MSNGYIGRIANSGNQVVKAPHQKKQSGGKKKITTGKDLRTGK